MSATDSVQAPSQKHLVAAWIGCAMALAAGLYWRNPAIALLGGLLVRLVLETNPVPAAQRTGSLALQTAIVLLGFTLGGARLLSVSADYSLIVSIYVLATLALGWVAARLFLRRRAADDQEPLLLTSGTAICGGTAIATLAPLVRAKPHEFAVCTALVFLLNAVALFTFPYIGNALSLSQETFGAWVALAIHDTSSVVATAAIYGDEAAVVATTVKLGRTLWLIPLAFVVSLLMRSGEAKLRVPGFVLLFVAAAASSSLIELPDWLISLFGTVSKALLVVALGLVGLQIDRRTVSQLSLRTVAFGVGLWLCVAPLALALVLYL